MKRQFAVTAAAALLLVLSSLGNVFAFDDYQSFTTAAWRNNAWVETSTFGLNEKPWLHLVIPDDINFNFDLTDSKWSFDGGTFNTITLPLIDTILHQSKNDLYLSFSDNRWFGLNGWQEIRKIGEWDVDAASILVKGIFPVKFLDGSVHLTVTPEPISAVLFWMGGGLLAAQVVRKKKRSKA